MDHSFINSPLVSLQEIKPKKEATAVDDYFGLNIMETLNKIKNDLNEVVLEILIEQKKPSSGKAMKRSIPYKIIYEDEPIAAPLQENDINSLLDRIEQLQNQKTSLLNKVTSKLQEIQRVYEKKDYKISIVKWKGYSDNSLETLPGTSADEQSSIPKSRATKRKISFSSESEKENPSQRHCTQEYPKLKDPCNYIIGPNGSEISKKDYETINWKDAASATRQLCKIMFGEQVLATHSLTGNQSPAFRGRERPNKSQLDPKMIADITYFVCMKFGVSQQLVRAIVTTKCADATKKIKRLSNKTLVSK